MLSAWNEFKRGKRKRRDVALFELNLEERLFALHDELIQKIYVHDPYFDFYVCDPKRRHIHKATVRDRVVHQAIFRALYLIFDRHFIFDSYSSRNNKGTHAGIERLVRVCRKETKNWRRSGYVLKCDIRKFFDSIDHTILRELIKKKVSDPDMIWIIDVILDSFEKAQGKGLPLGNVTSQLFANVYMNEFDQFVKHVVKANYYLRYCDDFVIVSQDKNYLKNLIPQIQQFLNEHLLLELHPHKVEIRKISQGIDFLGHIIFPFGKLVRMSTCRRMIRKVNNAKKKFLDGQISEDIFKCTIASFLGVFSHSRSKRIIAKIKRMS